MIRRARDGVQDGEPGNHRQDEDEDDSRLDAEALD